MTETQASASPAAADSDAAESADGAGRTVVGRATVSGDGPAPKFTRAPGMPAPPDSPDGAAPSSSPPGGVSTGRASVPAGARLTGTGPAESPTSVIGGTSAGARARAVQIGGAKVAEAVRNARAAVSSAASRGPRRARLFVKRIDPWSVMKFSFAVSFVLFFVAIVATAVLYLALDAMGVFASVNKALADMIGATGSKNGGFKITALGVIGVAGVLGLVNVVLFTALATLGAFIYNVCADLVGGIEVTLSERE